MTATSHRNDPVEIARALLRCPSVTPAEGGALSLIQSLLEPAGFTCHRITMREAGTPDVENLYARFGSTGPHLCFAGHTDVVPPGDEALWTHKPFAADIVDGILYGRGAVDMKGAIACFIAAALDTIAAHGGKPAGSLSFLITGDEEGPSINGTAKVLDWLSERGEKLDACLVGEPTSTDRLGDEIKIGRRGSVNGVIVVEGKQGHAAYPHLADNPVPKLARIIDRISTTPLDAGTPHFQPSSLQTTIVSVPNSATNVIPASAKANFNIRYNDLHSRPKIEAWVKDVCSRAAAEVGATFSLSFSGTGDVFRTEPGPLVAAMAQAVRAVTGQEAHLTTNGGTSDARFIYKHCPVIELGLRNATAHQVDEHVPVQELLQLTEIYLRFIAGMLGTGQG